ncbi:MAG: ParA family protein [Thiohalocapsa sp.]
MKIVGVYSIKGGVGKTSTAVNIAFLAAAAGNRTLVWDLDPQGAATYYFRVKPKVKGGGSALLRGKRELDEVIKGTDFDRLDLLPADFSYRNMDILLEGAKKRPTGQLERLMRPIKREYDLVFLDCPPSISLMSENIFRAADALLVPLIPSTLSARTLTQLTEFLAKQDAYGKLRLLPFFSLVDESRPLHTDTMDRLTRENPAIMRTSVPQAPEVERMGLHRMPLVAYAASNTASRAYRELWAELLEAL